MIKLPLTVFFLLLTQIIVAQNLLPTVVNSSGGVIQNASHSLEWSLGELATSTLSSSANLLTQGFLQPGTTNVAIENIFDRHSFLVFPNPVRSQLTLETDIPDITTIAIHDILGKSILQINFQQNIDLQHLESGIYIVSLFNQKNLLIHSFKINKI